MHEMTIYQYMICICKTFYPTVYKDKTVSPKFSGIYKNRKEIEPLLFGNLICR
jgi:hypothetical protein